MEFDPSDAGRTDGRTARRSDRHQSRGSGIRRSDRHRPRGGKTARRFRADEGVDRALRPDRKPRGCARAAAALFLLLLILAVATAGIAWYMLVRPDDSGQVAAGTPVHVVVGPGSSTSDIAQMLSEDHVISNALMFRLEVRRAGADGKLRAGEYDLATGMPDGDVIARLLKGPRIVTYEVPIPEGFTARQVAHRFAARSGIPEAELLALVESGASTFVGTHPYLTRANGGSLEGFLFPATYTVEASATAVDVVEMMLDHFDSQVAGIDLSYASSKNLDLFDVVTIASILEREAQLPEEYPLVSSVIYNRLARPMRLQLCATVMYEMPEGTKSLTDKDLELDSPYNTYLHDGLPIGPISNPGLAALKAAATPAETDYLYYVLTGKDGSQTFARTYNEFLKAKQVNKEVFGE